MDICKTCEYWNSDPNVDDVRDINEISWFEIYKGKIYLDPSQIASKFDIVIGKCTSPNLLKLIRPQTLIDVCLLDYEQEAASMVTASNFGCVNHKNIT